MLLDSCRESVLGRVYVVDDGDARRKVETKGIQSVKAIGDR